MTVKPKPDWSQLDDVDVDDEILVGKSVKDHILADAKLDTCYSYSSYGGRFACAVNENNTRYGAIGPGNLVPIWKLETQGAAKSWLQITALQLFQWNALAYEGCLSVSGDSGTGEQDFNLQYSKEELAELFHSQTKLMMPGGRIQLNIEEKFPCSVPWRKHPRLQDGRPSRLRNAMSPHKWLDMFGGAQVIEAAFPDLELVEIVGAADGNKPEDNPEDTRIMYDALQQKNMCVRPLALPPVSFSYGEDIMGGVPVAGADTPLREMIGAGIQEYLLSEAVDARYVGLAWMDHPVHFSDFDSQQNHESMSVTQNIVFKREHNVQRPGDLHTMRAASDLAKFQNGKYEPDLG